MSHTEGFVQCQVYFLRNPSVGIVLVTGRHYRRPESWLLAYSGSWHLLQTYTAKVNLSDTFSTGTLLVRRVGGEKNNECIKIKTKRGKNRAKIKAKSYASSEHARIVFWWHINLTHSLNQYPIIIIINTVITTPVVTLFARPQKFHGWILPMINYTFYPTNYI
jgi:hypothetical protein